MSERFIGIMSGTSLDGADAVLATFATGRPALVASASAPFPAALRSDLVELQHSGVDEIHRAALAANGLADFHAGLVAMLCARAGLAADDIAAIGSHGQTIRHRPDLGYTVQLDAPARLAEATGITVVADFRSRDVAAGGQGAPLVPAFHAALFSQPGTHRIVLNLGGIANVTDLPGRDDSPVRGWDCGPGNVLLDGWIAARRGASFDAAGAWAASGRVDAHLLERLLDEPWFALAPPKSTGRDLFDARWLAARRRDDIPEADVQATLAELTATSIVDSILRDAGAPAELIVCGGGAYNDDLLQRISAAFARSGHHVLIVPTSDASTGGFAVEHIEALAFAWLAMRCLANEPGNLPAVTGAAGLRVLGAIHPR